MSIRAEERIRAELTNAGYDVVTVPVSETMDQSRLRRIAERTTSSAVVSIVDGSRGIEGAVWVKDDDTGQESLREVRPALSSLEGASVFAIWAAEQVRASFIAFETRQRTAPVDGSTSAPAAPASSVPTSSPAAPSASAPAATSSAAPDRPNPPPNPPDGRNAPELEPVRKRAYSLAGGLAVLFGPGGVGWGMGPAATLSWRPEGWFGSVRFVGPVSSSLQTKSGKVDIDQEQILLRVGIDLGSSNQIFVPFVATGVGAYRLGARGDAIAPYKSTSNQAWSGVVQLSGGGRVRFGDTFFVAAEAGVWLAGSRPVVKIEGAPNASIGRPGFVISSDLGLSW